MDVSVIIPCKGEAANIAECLRRTTLVCPDAEILVIDSATDDTKIQVDQWISQNPNIQYFKSEPDRGKGDAIAQGICLATGDIQLQLDADLQFFPEDIPALIAPLKNGTADMVLGSRFLQKDLQSRTEKQRVRDFGNFFFSFLSSLVIRQKITDSLAGFKAWRKEVTNSYELECWNFSYELELFVKAKKLGFKIEEVPIRYAERKEGQSKVSAIKTGLTLLKDLMKLSVTCSRRNCKCL